MKILLEAREKREGRLGKERRKEGRKEGKEEGETERSEKRNKELKFSTVDEKNLLKNFK